jgi:hypothetical protein
VAEAFEAILRVLLIGVGATALLDLWSVLAVRAYGAPAPNWALVGRWIGHFPKGQFVQTNIALASPVRGELAIGWWVHYAIGIVYAAMLVGLWGLDWVRHPTLLPALIFGWLTLAAPFFIMQPGMGSGIAASRTPDPTAARLRSLVAHTVFGIGLYGSAAVAAWATRSQG